MNLPRAIEIMRLQKGMVLDFESGKEEDVRDFNARFMLLSDEFMKAIREPEQVCSQIEGGNDGERKAV